MVGDGGMGGGGGDRDPSISECGAVCFHAREGCCFNSDSNVATNVVYPCWRPGGISMWVLLSDLKALIDDWI